VLKEDDTDASGIIRRFALHILLKRFICRSPYGLGVHGITVFKQHPVKKRTGSETAKTKALHKETQSKKVLEK
jgi:hypothetical protein